MSAYRKKSMFACPHMCSAICNCDRAIYDKFISKGANIKRNLLMVDSGDGLLALSAVVSIMLSDDKALGINNAGIGKLTPKPTSSSTH